MTYTKEQITRAKNLVRVIFSDGITDPGPKFLRATAWGIKTNTGIINTVLAIMFDKK